MLTAASPTSSRRKLDEPAVIGKDILELLSSAMYVDPLSIYREYVQNSTDAIDEGHVVGLYDKAITPRISITLDAQQRSIKIHDNGPSVPANVFAPRLTSLGASRKRGSGARGFRGVGRLAGIAYCQRLIFRAKAKGARHVREIHWDCVRLKQLLRDAKYDGDVHDIMAEVIDFDTTLTISADDHFFEVELQGVNRIRNDILLNEVLVEAYLAQVGPVPFAGGFSFGRSITGRLATYGVTDTYAIYLNKSSDPIVRPFTDTFPAKKNLEDSFTELEFVEVPGINGDLDAIGWILHHGYHGAIPDRTGLKGLRLRAGNIQIGGADILQGVFPEPRFNAWTVGEFHLLSRRLIPNGRRDDLEQSTHQQNLISHLGPVGRSIWKRCRAKSKERHAPACKAETAGKKELTSRQKQLLAKCGASRRAVYREVIDALYRISPADADRLVTQLLEEITGVKATASENRTSRSRSRKASAADKGPSKLKSDR